MRTRVTSLALCLALVGVTSPAFASRYHAAIAYDASTGASGLVVDAPSPEVADRRALEACAQRGAACEVVVRFADSCAAYARGADGAHGYVIGVWTKRVAQSVALRECRRNGSGCAVVASGCTSPPPNTGSGGTGNGGTAPGTLHDQMRDWCHASGGSFVGGRCYRDGKDITP